MNTADQVAAAHAAELPAVGEAWDPRVPDLVALPVRRTMLIGGSGDGGWTRVQVLYASPGVAVDFSDFEDKKPTIRWPVMALAALIAAASIAWLLRSLW